MKEIEDKQKILIKYRIEQAKSAIKETKLLFDNEMYNAAVNRVYYGMFYVVSALALKYKFLTSKHGQLIGWFNKNFVKEKKVDIKYGKMLRDAFEYRLKGDYAKFIKFTKEEVLQGLNNMKIFINKIEEIILKPKLNDYV